MSLLDWQLGERSVTVLADTLATFDGGDVRFVPKVAIFPHLDLMMGLTGIHGVFVAWQAFLTRHAPGAGIDDLDDMATTALNEVWAELYPFGCDLRTTVRHWGWSEREGRFTGRSFRSGDGFKAEVMPEGQGMSPDPLPHHRGVPLETFEQWVEVCHGQRDQGLLEPEPMRVYVGGHLMAYTMVLNEGGGVLTTALKVDRFEGFDDHAAEARRPRPWGEW